MVLLFGVNLCMQRSHIYSEKNSVKSQSWTWHLSLFYKRRYSRNLHVYLLCAVGGKLGRLGQKFRVEIIGKIRSCQLEFMKNEN